MQMCINQGVERKRKWYIEIMEYYSEIKKNELLLIDTTWMNDKNITLHGRNQMQKNTYCMIPFKWNRQNSLMIEIRAVVDWTGVGGVY